MFSVKQVIKSLVKHNFFVKTGLSSTLANIITFHFLRESMTKKNDVFRILFLNIDIDKCICPTYVKIILMVHNKLVFLLI